MYIILYIVNFCVCYVYVMYIVCIYNAYAMYIT